MSQEEKSHVLKFCACASECMSKCSSSCFLQPPQFLGGNPPSSAISYIYNGAMPTMVQPGNEGQIMNQQIPGVISTAIPPVSAPQKVTRPDRLEVGPSPLYVFLTLTSYFLFSS